ncbi:hypothetical protein ACFPT7_14935 [Acidicapsa dinghuensis]|uniref:Uncharacterized protein n=1 Tax=Acidicapsa dinghuensis TaxID=2218256 RepID=A0ABW1EHF2_9BACT|nr:hypothetical protein [Acidicapsa dinghuensis]
MATAASGQRFDPDAAFLPSPVRTVSTVPPNGDGNPYGVAFVPRDFLTGSGPLHPGDVLVSNFNNGQGLQGTGTTIVRVPRKGAVSVFFQGTAPLGLTTALGTLHAGFVVVGNGPTADGTSGTATAGSLLVINNQGKLIQSITDPTIQYPWDMALIDHGESAIAFVTNALNGTVTRLKFHVYSWGLKLENAKVIASGYVNRGDPVTLFVAPTGLVYDERHDLLYVASTGDNAVFAVPDAASRNSNAGVGQVIYTDNTHLHGPLGMIEAPNGHLLVSNNDGINPDPNQPSEIVEFTNQGEFVKELSVDPAPGGAFGMAVRSLDDKAIFAAVDDNTNSLIIWTLNTE